MSIPSFVLVQGVITGLSYGLLAMGLVLIYKTNRVLNFAQGQLGVVAAVFMVKCFYDFGFNYWFALVLSLLLAAAVGGLSELPVSYTHLDVYKRQRQDFSSVAKVVFALAGLAGQEG